MITINGIAKTVTEKSKVLNRWQNQSEH